PQPALEPRPNPTLQVPDHLGAVPEVEVAAPAPQERVKLLDDFVDVSVLGPVVEDLSHGVAQVLFAFGVGVDVGIPATGLPAPLPTHAEAQEINPLLAIDQPGLFLVELHPSHGQPSAKSLAQPLPLPRLGEDDRVIRI